MNLSERFTRSKGGPIELEGRQVHAMYRRAVVPRQLVRVVWRNARPSPVQGLRLKLQRGQVEIAEQALSDVVLWTDSAPTGDVVVRCLVDKPTEFRAWNCWRDDRGTMQAWIGNAGMLIEELNGSKVQLLCNSEPKITFSDLIVDLAFEPPS